MPGHNFRNAELRFEFVVELRFHPGEDRRGFLFEFVENRGQFGGIEVLKRNGHLPVVVVTERSCGLVADLRQFDDPVGDEFADLFQGFPEFPPAVRIGLFFEHFEELVIGVFFSVQDAPLILKRLFDFPREFRHPFHDFLRKLRLPERVGDFVGFAFEQRGKFPFLFGVGQKTEERFVFLFRRMIGAHRDRGVFLERFVASGCHRVPPGVGDVAEEFMKILLIGREKIFQRLVGRAV